MTKIERFLWCVLYAFLLVLAGVTVFDANGIALVLFVPVVTGMNWVFYGTVESLDKELSKKKKKRP